MIPKDAIKHVCKSIASKIDLMNKTQLVIADEVLRIQSLSRPDPNIDIDEFIPCQTCFVVMHPRETYEQRMECVHCYSVVSCGRNCCSPKKMHVCGGCKQPLCQFRCTSKPHLTDTCRECGCKLCHPCSMEDDVLCGKCSTKRRKIE